MGHTRVVTTARSPLLSAVHMSYQTSSPSPSRWMPAVPTSRWLTLTPRTSNRNSLFYIVSHILALPIADVLLAFPLLVSMTAALLMASFSLPVMILALTRWCPASPLSPSRQMWHSRLLMLMLVFSLTAVYHLLLLLMAQPIALISAYLTHISMALVLLAVHTLLSIAHMVTPHSLVLLPVATLLPIVYGAASLCLPAVVSSRLLGFLTSADATTLSALSSARCRAASTTQVWPCSCGAATSPQTPMTPRTPMAMAPSSSRACATSFACQGFISLFLTWQFAYAPEA